MWIHITWSQQLGKIEVPKKGRKQGKIKIPQKGEGYL
jgi:hypothetical protein